ncbi:hypothetical protein [Yimella sp. RIT 621]|uniref:hypothetical protein n=1 Tax=Yimella sp. RIT 621 TaxID=2510323 RepID=UPI001459FCCD|nr:hypothetical protein [Yimella sp. RIT 621]
MATIGSVIPTLGTSTLVGTQPCPGVAAIDVGRLLSFGRGTTVDVVEEPAGLLVADVGVDTDVPGAELDSGDEDAPLVPLEVWFVEPGSAGAEPVPETPVVPEVADVAAPSPESSEHPASSPVARAVAAKVAGTSAERIGSVLARAGRDAFSLGGRALLRRLVTHRVGDASGVDAQFPRGAADRMGVADEPHSRSTAAPGA